MHFEESFMSRYAVEPAHPFVCLFNFVDTLQGYAGMTAIIDGPNLSELASNHKVEFEKKFLFP